MRRNEVCDKRMVAAIRAYADEVYGGDWEQVTIAELRGITAALTARPTSKSK